MLLWGDFYGSADHPKPPAETDRTSSIWMDSSLCKSLKWGGKRSSFVALTPGRKKKTCLDEKQNNNKANLTIWDAIYFKDFKLNLDIFPKIAKNKGLVLAQLQRSCSTPENIWSLICINAISVRGEFQRCSLALPLWFLNNQSFWRDGLRWVSKQR